MARLASLCVRVGRLTERLHEVVRLLLCLLLVLVLGCRPVVAVRTTSLVEVWSGLVSVW